MKGNKSNFLIATYFISGLYLLSFQIIVAKFMQIYHNVNDSIQYQVFDITPKLIFVIPILLIAMGAYELYNKEKTNNNQ